MANPYGPNGAQEKALRVLTAASGPVGFVTDRVLLAVTGCSASTFWSHIRALRLKGHSIERVKAPSGSGFRLLPPEQAAA